MHLRNRCQIHKFILTINQSSNKYNMFNFLINILLGKKEIICPSCAARFSVYKNHAGFELGVPIYCSMGCYLSQNPNPYES